MLKFLISARNIQSRKYTIDTLKSFYKQTQVFEPQLNNTTLYFRKYVTLDTTSHTKFCCPQYPPLLNRRSLHTTSAKNKDDDKPRKITIVRPRGLFKYWLLKVKLFLLRSYFDQKFDEEEFLIGAKQAVCYVAGNMADGKIEDLHGVLTAKGVQSCTDALRDYHGNPDLLKVKEEDIVDIRIVDVGFDYEGEEGEKFANVLVLCLLPGKEDELFKELKNLKNLKKFQFDIMRMVPRPIRYSFRRNYTPGGDSSDWLIDYVEYT